MRPCRWWTSAVSSKGASKGEGLGNKFLANIREVDATVFVLRAFEDDDVTGSPDPLEHLRVVEIELALADLETVEARLTRTQRASKLDRTLVAEADALAQAHAVLSEGHPIYRAGLKAEVRELLAPQFLLTNRSVLAVVNVGENELDRIPELEDLVRTEMNDAGDNVEVIGMCVQLEAEAATIVDPVERAEMLEGFGLGEGALTRMVRSAYHVLGLRTFLTTGDKESRAWTFRAGAKAPECAGRIHTDFQRGLHPRRGDPLGRAARDRVLGESQGPRQDPRRGQGLRVRRRRRHRVPIQRVTGFAGWRSTKRLRSGRL